MSKAFIRESDEDGLAELPEREVSSYPNLVTSKGLAAIDGEIDRHSTLRAAALEADDKDGLARAERELRYWTARRNTAQVAPVPSDNDRVRFGSRVTIVRTGGRRTTWRIVGEDEADPAHGALSHASPLARALMGKEVGDAVEAGATEAEIVAIEI